MKGQYGPVRLSSRSLIVVPTFCLVMAAAVLIALYPLATRPLSRPGDEPIIARARSDARLVFHDAEVHKRATFPIVMRLAHQTCVELRSRAADGAGTYLACYDELTGKKTEERTEAGF